MLKLLATCVVLSFLFGSSAMAQTGACAADIKKNCANVESGRGRIAACIKEHFTALSDVCKARVAEVVAASKACRADVEKQCSSARRRVEKVACVKNALSNLGDDCKAAAAAIVSGKK